MSSLFDRARLLVGISVFWVALSTLGDGVTSLVLPHHLGGLVDENRRATALGLVGGATWLVRRGLGRWLRRR